METPVALIATCKLHGLIARITITPRFDYNVTNRPVHCVQCRRGAFLVTVYGKPGVGRCDARCWDSIRAACKCSCGGHAHATTFGVFERE